MCACTHPNFFTIAKLYVRMLKIILRKGLGYYHKRCFDLQSSFQFYWIKTFYVFKILAILLSILKLHVTINKILHKIKKIIILDQVRLPVNGG